MLTLNHARTLLGEDWTLLGLRLRRITTPFHIPAQFAPISLRTAFAPLSIPSLQVLAAAPNWTPIHKLPQLNLEPLAPPPSLLLLPAQNTATWINSGAIIIIVIVAATIFIIVRIGRRYKQFQGS